MAQDLIKDLTKTEIRQRVQIWILVLSLVAGAATWVSTTNHQNERTVRWIGNVQNLEARVRALEVKVQELETTMRLR